MVSHLDDLAVGIGLVLIVIGLYWAWKPLAPLVAGLCLVWIGLTVNTKGQG